MRGFIVLSLAGLLALCATGCGQTGPLYLPGKSAEQPAATQGKTP